MKTRVSEVGFAPLLYISICILLCILSVFIPKGEEVLFINGNNSSFLDQFFATITHLGAGHLLILILIVSLFVRFQVSLLTIAVWISHGLVCSVFKRVLFRHLDRPKQLIDNQLLHFIPNVDVHAHFSFPSGHTATIFCICFLLSLWIKNRIVTVLLLLVALVVGYSRIYLLQHFLMDVAAGATIGVVCTYLFWLYFQKARLPLWASYYLKIDLSQSFPNKKTA
ncbi:MAG: phosphatase PAP2 family protein [Cyclobacteriaceae bacterium]|nr:phosphatase PAP2 family protein [Cyclobacteriaceae bacterium]